MLDTKVKIKLLCFLVFENRREMKSQAKMRKLKIVFKRLLSTNFEKSVFNGFLHQQISERAGRLKFLFQ